MAQIHEYRFGHINIDGEDHDKDVIILPGRIVSNWWRKDGHSLALEDLEDVIDELPKRLVVGAGAYGRMRPDPKTIEALAERGIEVEILETEAAVRRYGELDGREAAAALHLTC
jgi:hypothetical protein